MNEPLRANQPVAQPKDSIIPCSWQSKHLSTPPVKIRFSNLFGHLNTIRHNRLDIKDGLQKILHDLILSLLASLLDLCYLGLCILVRIFLGLLVSAGML
jgi:hypothetical protein